ncbi:MAG TPA: isochorismatase family protein [Paenirhodobacter sp.]
MTTALVIIDMQMAMLHRIEAGRDHVNPDAPARIAALAAAFRQAGRPVVHIRHRDVDPASAFHPQAPGYAPMPCAQDVENEPVFLKTTSSGFASTDLAAWLRAAGIEDLLVTGAVAGFCVNSTVRAGADLGFRMQVARDAVLGFDMPDAHLSARTIFDVTMAHLAADFAKVVDTADVLAAEVV